MKEASLHKALPIVAQAVGEKHGLTVQVGGQEACTNGQVIMIPSLPEGEAARVLARGFIDHEAAHVRCTNFNVGMDHLTNAIEDIRIEGEIGRIYPGSRKNLKDLAKHLVQERMLQVSGQEAAVDVFGKYANLTLRRDRLGQDLNGLAEEIERVMEARYGPKTRKQVDKILAGEIQSTKDAKKRARKLYKLLKEQEQDQQQGQGQQSQQQGQDDQADDSDSSSGQSGQDSQSDDGAEESSEEGSSQSGSDTEEGSGEDQDGQSGQEGQPGDDAEESSEEGSGQSGADSEGDSDEDQDGQSGADSEEDGQDGDDSGQSGQSGESSDDDSDEQSGSGSGSDDDSDGQDEDDSGSGSSASDDSGEEQSQAGDSQGSQSQGDTGDESSSGDQDGSQSGGQSGTDNDRGDSSSTQTGTGSGHIDPDQEGEFEGLGEMLREVLGALAQESNSGDPFENVMATPCNSLAVPEEFLRFNTGPAKQESAKLRKKLTGLLEAKRRDAEYVSRSGRQFAKKSLHRLATKDTRVFSRRAERDAPNTAIHVLLDTSGSMGAVAPNGDQLLSRALEVGYAIGCALDKVPHVQYAISSFPGSGTNGGPSGDPLSVDRVKCFEERLKASRFSVDASGCTPTPQAMWYVGHSLAFRQEERKLAFIITDGQPDNPEATKNLDAKFRRQGIEVLGIGILCPFVEHVFQDHLVVNNLEELAPTLFKALERKL